MPSDKQLWHKDLLRTVVPIYMPPLVPVRRLYHSLLTHLIPQDKEKDPAPFSPPPCATVASSHNRRLGDDCCSVHKAPLLYSFLCTFDVPAAGQRYGAVWATPQAGKCASIGEDPETVRLGTPGLRRTVFWTTLLQRAYERGCRSRIDSAIGVQI